MATQTCPKCGGKIVAGKCVDCGYKMGSGDSSTPPGKGKFPTKSKTPPPPSKGKGKGVPPQFLKKRGGS